MKNILLSCSLYLMVTLIALTFMQCQNKIVKKPPSPAAIIQDKATIKHQQVQEKIDTAKAKIASAKQRIKASKQKVIVAKAKAVSIVNTIAATTDTAQKLKACDSLSNQLTTLLVVQEWQDSLYDSLLQSYEQVVQFKDSQITNLQVANTALCSELDNSNANKLILEKDNKQLYQQANIAKVGNRILSTGLIAVASVVTYLKIIRLP
jgi:hypothetical protein